MSKADKVSEMRARLADLESKHRAAIADRDAIQAEAVAEVVSGGDLESSSRALADAESRVILLREAIGEARSRLVDLENAAELQRWQDARRELERLDKQDAKLQAAYISALWAYRAAADELESHNQDKRSIAQAVEPIGREHGLESLYRPTRGPLQPQLLDWSRDGLERELVKQYGKAR